VQIPFPRFGGFFGPLSLYIKPYLAQVREQGYAVGSLYEQLHVLIVSLLVASEAIVTPFGLVME
jgi:hypothetical protein